MNLAIPAIRGTLCVTFAIVLAGALDGAAAPVPAIAIDVGHTLMHAGATSARGRPEFDFNIDLAQRVRQAMDALQVRTVMIGEDGTAVLNERAPAAEKAGASFFLSVHHDSVQPLFLETWEFEGETRRFSDRYAGFSLFVSRRNPRVGESLRCARAMGHALIAAGFRASPHHGEAIAGENREWADQEAGVYYFDDLVVLRTASMPAVLFEAGIIVNRDEEVALRSPSSQGAMAAALAQGLAGCGSARQP